MANILSFMALARELLTSDHAPLAPPTALIMLIVLPFNRWVENKPCRLHKAADGPSILRTRRLVGVSALYRTGHESLFEPMNKGAKTPLLDGSAMAQSCLDQLLAPVDPGLVIGPHTLCDSAGTEPRRR
ncbi:hypothetical protein [Aquabacterium sp.]|uniref:hypothetical protein n=1 Tax=Aquabacterium sp. TaxID=1872578 RepID=UPI002D800455|nr:hypothetical protein [Aquabacterium sp.]